MNTPDNPASAQATEAARKALAKALDQAEIEVTRTETAVIPGTRRANFRITAIVPGKPNAPRQVVVDDAGKMLDLASFEASVGRRLFVPDIGIVPTRPAAVPERVSIDPAVNDLSLPDCKQQPEQITVTIPKSGVKPKADVYLLSDTTGSMTDIIGAVKAGAGAMSATRPWPGSTSPMASAITKTSRPTRTRFSTNSRPPRTWPMSRRPLPPGRPAGGLTLRRRSSTRCIAWQSIRQSVGAPMHGASSSGSATARP